MEPLTGLDRAFLALETETARFHVAAALVLDPPEGRRRPVAPATRFAQLRAMVAERLHLVPQLRQRLVRTPLDLLPPLWADDPGFDLDHHLHRAGVPAPGGPRELDELVAELIARPLVPDRPLWEMWVVEGLAGGRTALVAKLHHAILDGVSGASVMAAFLDLSPRPRSMEGTQAPWEPQPLPTTAALLRNALASLIQEPAAVLDVLQIGLDAVAGMTEQNRRLAAEGQAPPPLPFAAPRTSLNGALSPARRFASLSVPLADIDLVRRALGPRVGGMTFNDVVLCAVGAAVDRLLRRRGEVLKRPLVALVPVSTRKGPTGVERAPTPSVGGGAAGAAVPVGNQLSGMLVALPCSGEDPVGRLAALAAASRNAKEQERVAWNRLLDGVARATPHAVASWAARCASAVRLFDVVPPLFNLVISTVPGPDVDLWCAGSRVVAALPIGPVAHGVGLNVTGMTYRGTVHFGLLGCRRLVPDLDGLAVLLADAVAELVAVAAAVDPDAPLAQARPRPGGRPGPRRRTGPQSRTSAGVGRRPPA